MNNKFILLFVIVANLFAIGVQSYLCEGTDVVCPITVSDNPISSFFRVDNMFEPNAVPVYASNFSNDLSGISQAGGGGFAQGTNIPITDGLRLVLTITATLITPVPIMAFIGGLAINAFVAWTFMIVLGVLWTIGFIEFVRGVFF